jgi:Putative transposase
MQPSVFVRDGAHSSSHLMSGAAFKRSLREDMRLSWEFGKMTLGATEFLRRFFLHVLPKGFVRIRHFGFLANRFRASRLALGRQLLASKSTPEEVPAHEFRSESSSLWHCPRCGTSMIVIQRFTAAELSACAYFDSS